MGVLSAVGYEEVKDVTIKPSMTIEELIKAYGDIHGFMAGHLYRAVEILRSCMDADLRVMSFTANLVATGLRGIIAQLIRQTKFNLIITTAGTIDHDIARGLGGRYLKGFFEADDSELYKHGFHRLGNIFIPVEDYGPKIEKTVYSVLDKLDRDQTWSIYEILWKIGEVIKDENSIIARAREKRVPIIVPGYLDGAFGTALHTYLQTHKDLKINPFKDEELLAERFFSARKAMALIIGGGISKHHTIWWAQFRGGLDCAVYVTTAVEYDGSLSGAQPREAISWGKLKPRARHVVVYGDATLILPLLASSILVNNASGHH
ncbi:MAG: deoxyhypusine synthase [Pyrodictiaceae archaeon]